MKMTTIFNQLYWLFQNYSNITSEKKNTILYYLHMSLV